MLVGLRARGARARAALLPHLPPGLRRRLAAALHALPALCAGASGEERCSGCSSWFRGVFARIFAGLLREVGFGSHNGLEDRVRFLTRGSRKGLVGNRLQNRAWPTVRGFFLRRNGVERVGAFC